MPSTRLATTASDELELTSPLPFCDSTVAGSTVPPRRETLMYWLYCAPGTGAARVIAGPAPSRELVVVQLSTPRSRLNVPSPSSHDFSLISGGAATAGEPASIAAP